MISRFKIPSSPRLALAFYNSWFRMHLRLPAGQWAQVDANLCHQGEKRVSSDDYGAGRIGGRDHWPRLFPELPLCDPLMIHPYLSYNL